MQTEPLLIYLPPGIAVSKVAAFGPAPNIGSGEFDVNLGLDAGQPGALQEDSSALPSADALVAWAGTVWLAVPLTSPPAWPAGLPSAGSAPFDAKPVEKPAKAGLEAWSDAEAPLSTGDLAKAGPAGEGSIGPILIGPISDRTVLHPAKSGDSLRVARTSFPAADPSGGSSPPPEGGSLFGSPQVESAFPTTRPPSTALPAHAVPDDSIGPRVGRAIAGSPPHGSASGPEARPLPVPVGMNFGIAALPARPTDSVGEAQDPRQGVDLAPPKSSTLVLDRQPMPDGDWPAVSDTTDKPNLAPSDPTDEAEAPLAMPTHRAAMMVRELAPDPQSVLDPAESVSDPAAPANDRAPPAFPALATGAEHFWQGAQHLRAERVAAPAELNGGIGLSGKDANGALRDRAPVSQAIAEADVVAVPFLASSLAILALRQAEDPLLFADAALGVADRLPLPSPVVSAFPSLPAASVLQVAAQITAALTHRPDGTTEVALSPQELGGVRLQFQTDAQNPDRIVVILAFDRPETMDLFRRHADQLTEAVRSAGYSEARLDFGQSGAGSGDGAGPGWAGHNDDGAGPLQSTASEATATGAEPDRSYALQLSGVAGMDLRL